MNHAFMGPQLIAAWSIKLNIVWPRFIVAMVVLGAMAITAAWLDQKGKAKKK
jgi:hypothetical protein